MKVGAKLFARLAGAKVALCLAPHIAIAQSPTTRIVNAATGFLVTLDATQKTAVQFAFDDDTQRARWSNFPVQMSRRAGLKLGDLTAAQRTSAMVLVSAALSKRGYEKVLEIMEADEVLKANERASTRSGKRQSVCFTCGTRCDTARQSGTQLPRR